MNDNAYFAEGIQDEILTKLASVRDLKVISAHFDGESIRASRTILKTVAQELGVANYPGGERCKELATKFG